MVVEVEQGKKNKNQCWASLETKIFSNEDMQKVFCHCQKAAEYLYCTRGIQLGNVFDIRVSYANY